MFQLVNDPVQFTAECCIAVKSQTAALCIQIFYLLFTVPIFLLSTEIPSGDHSEMEIELAKVLNVA